MKIGLILSAAALGVAAVAAAAKPVQDARGGAGAEERSDVGQGMDMQAMQAAFEKAAQLGPQHYEFKRWVGTWNAKVTSYETPGQPPQVSKGTSRYEMALGDRFIIEHHKGTMPGMGDFEGLGILGYNNMTQEYEHVWLDSMGTGMMMSHGKKDADGAITFKGLMDDGMGGKMECRMVVKHIDDDHTHFEMFCQVGGIQEMKMVEIDYTRAKEN